MLKIKAYAKVNLYLKVEKKDLTGYHKIESLITYVKNLYDEILILSDKETKDIIVCNKKTLEKNNFLFIVLKILREREIINKFYKIKLKKRIPLGAGLGGGTSDAFFLAKYFTQDKKILKEIAKQVGYDSFFYISSFHSAIVSSYGEAVKKFENEILIKKKDLILTKVFCDTKKVYENFDYVPVTVNSKYNNLTDSACKLYPELKKYISRGVMSGSGSTFIKNKTFNKIKKSFFNKNF
ncbi:4-diphosphocytidyl-2-C-methyl-D-erythritol kinase [Spiroplasma gladiatoris]|uniref:4-diphosphocytidyl-2-C-methyl-D-erythritol kinase n=1 Tax=Spiroplasma gladiatoris TaxID=2143 RepID=A0A4P7AKY0_9MOLU|nr:hypothetical protein [Spiroplasma gladiatoris]QBQ08210.1 4-diphosphocytidyl-2-C-methyl-D-erythritol kinase [Spiroplasma gladiatoris]